MTFVDDKLIQNAKIPKAAPGSVSCLQVHCRIQTVPGLNPGLRLLGVFLRFSSNWLSIGILEEKQPMKNYSKEYSDADTYLHRLRSLGSNIKPKTATSYLQKNQKLDVIKTSF